MRSLPGIAITGLIVSLLWVMFIGLLHDPLLRSGMIDLPLQSRQLLVVGVTGAVIGLLSMSISYQLVRAIAVALLGTLLGWGVPYIILPLLGVGVISLMAESPSSLVGLVASMIPPLIAGKLLYKASLGPPPPRRPLRPVRIKQLERPPPGSSQAERRLEETGQLYRTPPTRTADISIPFHEHKHEPRREEVRMGYPMIGPEEGVPIPPREGQMDTGGIDLEKLSPQEKRLVELLSTSESREIAPVPDRTSMEGGRYPEIEELLRTDTSTVINLLQSLASKNILKIADLEFKVIICPRCGSSLSMMDFVCKVCRSPNISRQRILQHLICGYLGPESMFVRDGKLVCPRCGETVSSGAELDEAAMQTPGQMGVKLYSTFYRCLDCGEINTEPHPSFRCLTCGRQYDSRSFKVRHFYRYVVNEAVFSRIVAGHLPIKELSKRLRELGYEVRVPASLTGSSGVNHRLDMLVLKDNRNIVGVIVISLPENATISEIMRISILKLDTGVPKLVVLATSSLSDDALRLAEFQGLEVVDMNHVRDLINEVVEPLVRSVIREAEDPDPSLIGR